ncbi:MAG: photosynthetic complex assembly protein PuhC [Lysobacterales bacterium]
MKVIALGPKRFPALPLLVITGVLVTTFVVASNWSEPTAQIAPTTAMTGFRALSFKDGAGGEVFITDAQSGEAVETLSTGHGFLRATLRSLARTRVEQGHRADAPFHLEQYASGQLLLIDPTTGKTIDLWAFGAPNKAVFEKYVSQIEDAGPQRASVREKS